MAERKYKYVSTDKLESIQAGGAFVNSLFSLGSTAGKIYKADEELNFKNMEDYANSYISTASQAILEGKDYTKYEEGFKNIETKLLDASTYTEIGIPEFYAKRFINRNGSKISQIVMGKSQIATEFSAMANIQSKYYTIYTDMAKTVGGKDYEEIVAEAAVFYDDDKNKASEWDPTGAFDPNQPTFQLTIANEKGMTEVGEQWVEYIKEHPDEPRRNTIDAMMKIYTDILDKVDLSKVEDPLARADFEAKKNEMKRQFEGILRGTVQNPRPDLDLSFNEVNTKRAGEAAETRLQISDEFFEIKKEGKAIAPSDIVSTITAKGLKTDNPYDRETIMGMYADAETWNATLLAPESLNIITYIGGYDGIKDRLDKAEYITKDPVGITKDGYRLTGGEGQTMSEDLKAIYTSAVKGEPGGTIYTYYQPLLDEICAEYNVTSDETKYALAEWLNEQGKAYGEAKLKANDNYLMDIARSENPDYVKRILINQLSDTASEEGVDKALNAIEFPYNKEFNNIKAQLKDGLKGIFKTDTEASAIYNSIIHRADFDDRLQEWILTHSLDANNIDAFVKAQVELYLSEDGIEMALNEMDSYFMDNYVAYYSDTVFPEGTTIPEAYRDVKNGKYHLWEDAEAQTQLAKDISAEFDSGKTEEMDLDKYMDTCADLIYGKEYKDLTPTEQIRVQVNTFEVCVDAVVYKVLDNNFGFKRRGIKTKQIDCGGFGSGLLTEDGYIYLMSDPSALTPGKEANGFLVGKVDMSEPSNKALFDPDNEHATISDPYSLHLEPYHTDYKPAPIPNEKATGYQVSDYAKGEKASNEVTSNVPKSAAANNDVPFVDRDIDMTKSTPSSYATGGANSNDTGTQPRSSASYQEPVVPVQFSSSAPALPEGTYYPGLKVPAWEDPKLDAILAILDAEVAGMQDAKTVKYYKGE